MTNVLGINIVESSISSPTTTSTGLRILYMVGIAIAVTAANQNIPTPVSSITDFNAKFNTASETITESVKIFFLNYPNGKLYFIGAYDSTITGTGSALDKGHITGTLTKLLYRPGLESGILVVPEIINYTVQGDRTAIFAAAEVLVNNLHWIHFVNTGLSIDTKAEALAERALYTSLLGKSALYYGLGITPDNKTIPLSVLAGAVGLKRFAEQSPYSPPAGVLYPIKGISSIVGYVFSQADHEELRTQGINVIQDFPGSGYCFSGSRTLSTNVLFSQINTVVSIVLTINALIIALLPLIYEASDPQGYIRREAKRRITTVMQNIYKSGGLSGNTSEEAFRIEEVPISSTSTQDELLLRKVTLKVYARFVGTLEQIEIDLINVDLIPVAA